MGTQNLKHQISSLVPQQTKSFFMFKSYLYIKYRSTETRNICYTVRNIWDKVFKSGLSKFCGRQPFKNLKGYDLLSVCQFVLLLPFEIFDEHE